MQPTFLRLFADNENKGTEYLAISTITRVFVEKRNTDKGESVTKLLITTAEGATKTVEGEEVQRVIAALDSLAVPAPTSAAP